MFTRLLVVFLLASASFSTAFADELIWGNTYAQVWQGFGTGPYSAHDTTTGKSIILFCLDFNDEIAPPFTWNATARVLNSTNVTHSAQYGGNYDNLLNQSYGATHSGHPAPNQVSEAPFSFVTDNAGGGYGVDLSLSSDAYSRYLEAAWLFTELQAAGGSSKLALVAQVAAWDLLVDSAHKASLSTDIANTNASGKIYGFQDLVGGSGKPALSGLDFQQAVDYMLSAAQQSVVVNKTFTGAGWSIVTGDPDWVESASGKTIPAQEFLSPNAIPPSVPEPSAVILLATAIGAAALLKRRRAA